MSGCRNNAVSSQSGPDAAAESAEESAETGDTGDVDLNYPKEFDDSHYTDLTEIENKYKDLGVSIRENKLSNVDYGNAISDLADQYLKSAQTDYNEIQRTLDYIFSLKYGLYDIHNYFNAGTEKKKVSDYWTSELNRIEKEKALQYSAVVLTYTGGSIGGILDPEADFKCIMIWRSKCVISRFIMKA